MNAEERLYLQYNLQFFANDDATEEPTEKKLSDARKKGQVAKSKELESAVGLLALFLMLRLMTEFLGQGFVDIFNYAWPRIPDIMTNAALEGTVTSNAARQAFTFLELRMLLLLAPFLVVGVAVAFIVNILQIGFKVTTEPMKPKFNKLNPASGIKRIFSKDSLVQLLLSIAKVLLCAVIAYTVISGNIDKIFVIYGMDTLGAVIEVGTIILDAGIRISAVFLVLGFVDLIYQKRKFHKDMMMTKQEVKDEYKNTEGDPQIKGQQKQRMREASQRRMMQDVPKADVVITNPTHYAVAVRYDNRTENAPVVLAKGADLIARRIRDVATEAGVPITENKPLARMLYQSVDIGEEIPPELYQAVAVILADIYRMNGRAG